MSAINGGPAFPISQIPYEQGIDGMSMRDYFAAKAMHGFITESGINIGPNAEADDAWYAKKAYEMADAMIKVRNEK
jgi:hypothetical protein